jgi:hypothetical protein
MAERAAALPRLIIEFQAIYTCSVVPNLSMVHGSGATDYLLGLNVSKQKVESGKLQVVHVVLCCDIGFLAVIFFCEKRTR